MNSSPSVSGDDGGQDVMQHLMIDNELNKIFWNIGSIEQTVDADDFGLVIIGAQFDLCTRHGFFAAMPLNLEIQLPVEVSGVYI